MFQFAKPEWEVKAKASLSILEAKADALGSTYSNIQKSVIEPLQERRKILVHNRQNVMNKDGYLEEIAAIDSQIEEAQRAMETSAKPAARARMFATKARRAYEEATNTKPLHVSFGG